MTVSIHLYACPRNWLNSIQSNWPIDWFDLFCPPKNVPQKKYTKQIRNMGHAGMSTVMQHTTGIACTSSALGHSFTYTVWFASIDRGAKDFHVDRCGNTNWEVKMLVRQPLGTAIMQVCPTDRTYRACRSWILQTMPKQAVCLSECFPLARRIVYDTYAHYAS